MSALMKCPSNVCTWIQPLAVIPPYKIHVDFHGPDTARQLTPRSTDRCTPPLNFRATTTSPREVILSAGTSDADHLPARSACTTPPAATSRSAPTTCTSSAEAGDPGSNDHPCP